MHSILLGTQNGIVTLRSGGDDRREMEGHDVWVVAHRPDDPDIVFAGTYGDGLWRRQDGRWRRLPDPPAAGRPGGQAASLDYIRAIAFDPHDPLTVYAGTEPANVLRSTDGGDTWLDLGLRTLPGAEHWSLPYSPRGGAVRTLTLHPGRPSLVYGGVEQGGLIKSTDGGLTWTITADGVHRDVHHVAVHPLDADQVLVATGGGLFRSSDGGLTWVRLLGEYIRAVLIHPLTPEWVLAAPARYVGRQGRILASLDGGNTWAPAGEGLAQPMDDMVEAFVLHPDYSKVFAVRDNGHVIHSRIEPLAWEGLEPDIGDVRSLAVVEGV